MGSLKLLLVEDDLPRLELMEEVFTSLQADVRPVNNSETAAALVGKEKFDGIFLDLEMPAYMALILQTGSVNHRGTDRLQLWCRGEAREKPCNGHFRLGQLLPAEAGGPAKAEPPVAHRRGGMLQSRRRSVRIPLHTEVMCSVDARTIRGTTWNISQRRDNHDQDPHCTEDFANCQRLVDTKCLKHVAVNQRSA
jgi:hypothetical protein